MVLGRSGILARGSAFARAVVAIVVAAAALSSALSPDRATAATSANLVRYPTGTAWVVASANEIDNGGFPASAAIDGSTTTDWAAIGCSPGDWWRATFSETVTLDRVRLQPRDGACDNFGYGRLQAPQAPGPGPRPPRHRRPNHSRGAHGG